jgi:hypothetical protein
MYFYINFIFIKHFIILIISNIIRFRLLRRAFCAQMISIICVLTVPFASDYLTLKYIGDELWEVYGSWFYYAGLVYFCILRSDDFNHLHLDCAFRLWLPYSEVYWGWTMRGLWFMILLRGFSLLFYCFTMLLLYFVISFWKKMKYDI